MHLIAERGGFSQEVGAVRSIGGSLAAAALGCGAAPNGGAGRSGRRPRRALLTLQRGPSRARPVRPSQGPPATAAPVGAFAPAALVSARFEAQHRLLRGARSAPAPPPPSATPPAAPAASPAAAATAAPSAAAAAAHDGAVRGARAGRRVRAPRAQEVAAVQRQEDQRARQDQDGVHRQQAAQIHDVFEKEDRHHEEGKQVRDSSAGGRSPRREPVTSNARSRTPLVPHVDAFSSISRSVCRFVYFLHFYSIFYAFVCLNRSICGVSRVRSVAFDRWRSRTRPNDISTYSRARVV